MGEGSALLSVVAGGLDGCWMVSERTWRGEECVASSSESRVCTETTVSGESARDRDSWPDRDTLVGWPAPLRIDFEVSPFDPPGSPGVWSGSRVLYSNNFTDASSGSDDDGGCFFPATFTDFSSSAAWLHT